MDPLIDRVISHYRLVAGLDAEPGGCMYRAVDENLGREVAIRLLPPDRRSDPTAVARFRTEAQIASALSHPHIRAVHDYAETREHVFTVCELLEGRTLADEIAERRLPAGRALELAVQIAEAVAAAHGRRIAHGLLDAQHVFVTSGGHAKLLGFGAAYAARMAPAGAAAGAATQETGARTATASSSSASSSPSSSDTAARPEDTVGFRSDVTGVAELLRLMLTGGSPEAEVPAAVRPVIEAALAPRTSPAFADVAALLAELRRVRRVVDPSGIHRDERLARLGGLRGRRRHAAAAALVVVVASAAFLAQRAGWLSGWGAPGERDSILLAEVVNGTADPDFDGTLRQALAVHLSQSPFLDVVSDDGVREALRLMGRAPDARLTHEIAREACVRLGLKAMVEGSVAAVGRVTLVSVVATDCQTGETISRGQAEVEAREAVLRAIGSLASRLRADLGESLASLERYNVPIEQATTPSLEALKAYTLATARRAAGREVESIPLFERAIELDPNFALAYTTLSSVYGNLGETDLSERYAQLAYERSGLVSERERLFLAFQYHDRVTGDQHRAIEALEVWKRSFPKDYRAPNALALVLNRLGQYDRAIVEAGEAQRRNPDHPFPYSNLAYAHRGAGQYDEARAVALRAVERGIETLPTRRLLYQVAELRRDPADAARHLEWARGQAREYDLVGAQAQAAAFHGRLQESRDAHRQTVALARGSGFPEVATGYLAQAAWTEALYGHPSQAVAQAREVVLAAKTFAPRLRAAAALALAGATREAQAIVGRERGARPEDTLLHRVYLPIAEGALALAAHRAEEAIERLRPAAPYERGTVAVLAPAYLRGRAFALRAAYADAAREFRVVIDHRGADPFSPLYPLARLELGRALARQGLAAQARAEYDALLALWSTADADLPPLVAARAERAALQ